MSAACSPPEPESTPFATWNPARGVRETAPINPACGHWACYSQTWPTSGTTRTGRAYAPPTSAPRTAANASSSPPGPRRPDAGPLLKTPTANLGSNGGSQHPDKRKAAGHGPTLADEIEHFLPTPRASDNTSGSPNHKHGTASTETRRAAHGTPAGAAAEDDPAYPLPHPASSDETDRAGTPPTCKVGVNQHIGATHPPAGGAPTWPPSDDGST
ncbi:hypothetical protein GCM10009802_06720 [Streptomyces synnematoformans]|uniref:Uncharacterized protein n=1 Tax=Streptomyces synnematoformans TaxID=415721 RepID=A0ABN2XD19_9ACTN